MDYKHKYLKYKNKYLSLKNDLSIKGSGILDDNTNIFQKNSIGPDSIRIIKDISKNKIIILLGERHKDVQLYNNTRIDPKIGYDKFLGRIFKNMNIAIKNKDGLHDNDPFKKVLFLTETKPTAIFLGGKKELDSDLFVEKKDTDSLEYARNHLEKNKDKYKDNMLIIDADLRKNLGISNIMPNIIHQKIEKKFNIDNIQDDIDHSIFIIKNFILDNNGFPYDFFPYEDIKPDEISKLYNFFTGNEAAVNIPNRQVYNRSKRLENIFIKTSIEFTYFKEMLKEDIDIIEKHPKIFIDEKYSHLNLMEKWKIYNDLCPRIDHLISRLMDFYILEYIEEISDCSTTVIIAGEGHTDFLFRHLCIVENYLLVETEKKIFVKIPNTIYYKPDLIIFPYNNQTEIFEFNSLIKIIRNEIKNFNLLNDKNKKFFYNNLLTSKNYYYITKKTDDNENIELPLIDSFGYFFIVLKNNRTSLYSQNISFDYILPI